MNTVRSKGRHISAMVGHGKLSSVVSHNIVIWLKKEDGRVKPTTLLYISPKK